MSKTESTVAGKSDLAETADEASGLSEGETAYQRIEFQMVQNAIPISYVATNNGISRKKLNRLDCSFMYTQIIKEILLEIKFEENNFKEFIQHCRSVFVNNKDERKKTEELEKNYYKKTPTYWYTWDSFLYPMLNRALRLMNTDILIKLGFFINDLHRQIRELHNEQFTEQHNDKIFTVYRGQGLSKADFEQMKKTKGGLMSFNNFLSTSRNRDTSLKYVNDYLHNPDMVGILFIMTIDPSQSTAPFASIEHVSRFQNEGELLFSMHTIFRIHNIKPTDANERLFEVNLTLTSDNDEDLRVLTECMRDEIEPGAKGWYRLGGLLCKIGEYDKAEQVYEVLIGQAKNDIGKACIYPYIGWAKAGKGEYKEALRITEKALEILHLLPLNHYFANFYNIIGRIYDNMSDYTKAVLYCKKALKIQQQSPSSNHRVLAAFYNNIGNAYRHMADYSKALLSYEKALEIEQQLLPSNHPDLAAGYLNIGNVYRDMADYSKALKFYKKALQIQQKSLPPNHPDLATTYNSIGLLYKDMGENSKALSYYEKDLEINLKTLSPNHPDLASSYNNIGNVYFSMGEYSKALSSHEKALQIKEQSLPPNHPDFAASYCNIGVVYCKTGEYSKALWYYKKDLEISEKTLPPNHPDLAVSYGHIADVYSRMGNYPKALSYRKKDLEISQKALPPNHPDLAESYSDMGLLYYNMGEYSEALLYYEQDLEISEKALRLNHPDLAVSYSNIGGVYHMMGEHAKALPFCERAVNTAQQSLPPNDPQLQKYKDDLVKVKLMLYLVSAYP